jgi:hypothetical protein
MRGKSNFEWSPIEVDLVEFHPKNINFEATCEPWIL